MNVTLSGGPFDGKTVVWNGGDFLEMASLPPASFAPVDSSVLNEQTKVDKLLYRRSVNNPNIFVFQP